MPGCNESNCTCQNTGCVRHGKCCECVNFHRERGSIVNCFKNIDTDKKEPVVK